VAIEDRSSAAGERRQRDAVAIRRRIAICQIDCLWRLKALEARTRSMAAEIAALRAELAAMKETRR
jgi:hypothetical protein